MNLPAIPFELILIVLFFVLPALGNLQRRFRGRGGQGDADRGDEATGKGQRRHPTNPSTATPGAPTQASTQARPTSQTTPQPQTTSDIPRWLEEAQRRVRESQASEPSRRAGPRSERREPPRTVGKPLFDPLPDQPTAQTRPAQTRPVQVRPVGSLETLRPEGSTTRAAKAAPPLRVQRQSGNKRATLKPDKLRFDASTLMNGITWHQVLSPPLSKRRIRLSPRRP